MQEEGKKAYDTADYQTALQKWGEGLKQARTLHDDRYISQFLTNLKSVYDTTSAPAPDDLFRLQKEGEKAYAAADYQTALEKWQTGLAQARKLNNNRSIGYFLNSLGLTYRNLKQPQQALTCYQQALEINCTIGNKQEEAYNLNNLGVVHVDDLGQPQQALTYYQQALEINRALGNKPEEMKILNNLGLAYRNLKQPQQALTYYQQALELNRTIGNKQEEAYNLNNLGVVYVDDLGQPQQALTYYQQALEINRMLRNKAEEGKILNNLIGAYRNLSQYQEVLAFAQQALTIFRELRNRNEEGNALSNIGFAYSFLGQYQQALAFLEQALVLWRELGDRWGESNTLCYLGIIYSNTGQYQKAIASIELALDIARKLGDRSLEGSCIHNFGIVYYQIGRYQEALGYFQQTVRIYREFRRRRDEGYGLCNLGNAYRLLGQYQQASKFYEQALSIAREVNDRYGEGASLGSLGLVYNDLGQYREALSYFEQALVIHHELGERNGEETDLSNLGMVYFNLGQYQRTLTYYDQAMTIQREISDRKGEGTTLNHLGDIYNNLGQYQQALSYYEQALTIRREIGDRCGEGDSLGALGAVYQNLRQYQEALKYIEQSLVIYRELGTQPREGNALETLGMEYYYLGQYQKAVDTLQNSLKIVEDSRINSLWRVRGDLAAVEVKLNQPESAIAHYEQALDTIEQLRAGLKEKDQKLSFMQNKLFVYDEFITLLQDQHQKQPDKGYDRKALEIFERKQGRVFLEEMGQSGARNFAGLPEEILQKEREWEDQREQTRKQLGDERSKPLTGQNKELIQELEQREKTLQTGQAALQAQIKTGYPDYYALRYPKPASLADLQQQVLHPGELLLVYHVMEKSTILWVVQPDAMQMYPLSVGETQLAKQITELRQTLKYEYQNPKKGKLSIVSGADSKWTPTAPSTQLSYELYAQLFPEAVRSLLTASSAGNKTLHIVPTGPLYALPFEALVTTPPTASSAQDSEVHYLIENLPVNYLSSASLLKTLREAEARRGNAARYPLLAFAHPTYQPVPTSKKLNPFQTLRQEATRSFFDGAIPELPETAEEAQTIAALLNAPAESEPLQLRAKASRANVFALNTAARLVDYQYVIFATHGVLPGEVTQVKQSALILSDDYLTMADVFGLSLNAKLVALSACNTGQGEQVRGEGVMGLTRAFMYAGTPAIAVTLWAVESRSAKDLNVGLFEYSKNGQAPAQALQSVKVQMLRGAKGERYRHPYYWAPFVVFGDGWKK